MTISELQSQISEQQSQLSQAEQNVKSFNPRIQQTTAQLFRATPTTQARVQSAELTRSQAKTQAMQEISQARQELGSYQQNVEEYLKSPAGMLQYAKESGMQPTSYEPYYSPDIGQVQLPVYNTPYGKVTDQTPIANAYKELSQSRLVTYGYSPSSVPTSFQQAQEFGGKIVTPSGYTLDFAKGVQFTPEQTQAIQGYEAKGYTPVFDKSGSITGFQDTTSGRSFQLPKATITEIEADKLNLPTENVLTYSQPQQTTGFLNKLKGWISNSNARLQTQSYRGEISPLGKVEKTGLGLLGGAIGLVEPFLHPIQSLKGIKTLATDSTTRQEYFSNLGETIRTNPEYSTGYAISSLAIPYGISKGISGIKTASELRAIDNAPVLIKGMRYENSGGGVDFLIGSLKTDKSSYLSKIQQPFLNLEGGRTILESGQGTTFRLSGNDLSALRFESGGRLKALDTTPNLVNIKTNSPYLDSGIKTTQSLKDIQADIGRVYFKPTGEANTRLALGFNPFTSKTEINARGTIKLLNSKPVYSNIAGISRQSEGFIDILSGKPRNIKMLEGNRISLSSDLKTASRIKRLSAEDFKVDSFSGSNLKTGTTSVKASPTYAEKLFRESAKSIAKSTSKTETPVLTKISPSLGATQTISEVKKETLSSPMSKSLVATNEATDVLAIPRITSATLQIGSTRQEESQSSLSGTLQIQTPRTNVKPFVDVLSIPRVKTEQKTKTDITNVFYNSNIPARVQAKPKIKINPGMMESSTKNHKDPLRIKKSKFDLFITTSRRRGKDIIVGMSKNPFEAKLKGERYTLRTLGASFKVKSSSGRDVLLRPNRSFRLSKKDPFRLVQRSQKEGLKGGRLSNPLEVREIQLSRKRNKKFRIL